MTKFDLTTIVQLPMGAAQKHPVIGSVLLVVGAATVVKVVLSAMKGRMA